MVSYKPWHGDHRGREKRAKEQNEKGRDLVTLSKMLLRDLAAGMKLGKSEKRLGNCLHFCCISIFGLREKERVVI